MSVFILKLFLTPLFIAGASLAQRRWGPALAGLLAGLPWVSAPVSIFLALERGPFFAAGAARGTLLGTVAMCTFCVVYARAARRASWPLCTVVGLLACALTTLAAAAIPADLALSAAVAVVCVAGLIWLMGKPAGPTPARRISWWDLPARMVVATALVLLITGGAGWLGPQWSGLLASLPVMSSVLGVFTHSRFGAEAAQALLRGVCVSALGVLAFYLVVGSLLGRLGIAATYVVATCAALVATAACRPLATGAKL